MKYNFEELTKRLRDIKSDAKVSMMIDDVELTFESEDLDEKEIDMVTQICTRINQLFYDHIGEIINSLKSEDPEIFDEDSSPLAQIDWTDPKSISLSYEADKNDNYINLWMSLKQNEKEYTDQDFEVITMELEKYLKRDIYRRIIPASHIICEDYFGYIIYLDTRIKRIESVLNVGKQDTIHPITSDIKVPKIYKEIFNRIPSREAALDEFEYCIEIKNQNSWLSEICHPVYQNQMWFDENQSSKVYNKDITWFGCTPSSGHDYYGFLYTQNNPEKYTIIRYDTETDELVNCGNNFYKFIMKTRLRKDY